MRKVWAALLLAAIATALPLSPEASADDAPFTLRSTGTGDTDARGTYGATSFFVPIPPGTAVSGSVSLDIDFSHSELLLPDVSTMTVRVNDTSLASTFLTAANQRHGHLVVPVPPEIIGTDGLFVETRFYMRLTRDACEEPTNPALWATVHGASVVTLPTALAGPRDLGDVPSLVIPARSTAKPLTIVVPDEPNDTLLRAAGVVATTAGGWLGAAGRDAIVNTSSTPPVDAPSIEVGVMLDVPGVDVRAAKNGVIAVSQDGPVRVTVTGPTATAALRAARALAFVERLHGAGVTLSGRRFAPDPKRTPPWTASSASFHQLGIDRLDVAGPGTKTFDLVVERPPGWKLERTGRIALDIDTAPGVRRGPSFVQVRANGYDLGTQRLLPGGGKRRYEFDVAGGLVDRDVRGRPKRSIQLQVRVHLMPEQRTCTPLDAEATNASVLTTSKITLPHASGGRLDVGRFPASVPDPLVVLEDNRPPAVAAGLQAAASIGRWAPDAAAGDRAHVLIADAVTQKLRTANNLVLLGDADRALDRPITIDDKPVATSADSVVAFAGLVPSPFRSEKSALVVSGDPEGVVAALRALGSRTNVEALAGKVVAVLSDSPKSQTLVAETGAAPPVELAPTLTKSRIRSETIIGGVLLAAFLAAVVLVIRFRWRSPRS